MPADSPRDRDDDTPKLLRARRPFPCLYYVRHVYRIIIYIYNVLYQSTVDERWRYVIYSKYIYIYEWYLKQCTDTLTLKFSVVIKYYFAIPPSPAYPHENFTSIPHVVVVHFGGDENRCVGEDCVPHSQCPIISFICLCIILWYCTIHELGSRWRPRATPYVIKYLCT